MKIYPYNRRGLDGRRIFRLLDQQYNPGVLEASKKEKAFETYDVPTVMQCRANKSGLLFESNLTGIKRPSVYVEADIEMAWGEFSDDVTTLDFTHGQELPLTYVQPIEDDTMKTLIDAGLYSDPRFEELLSKIMSNEVFDAESDMSVTHLDVGDEAQDEKVPVVLVDPVHVSHEDEVQSEQTTVSDLVKRSALLVIALRKDGVKTDELVETTAPQTVADREVFVSDKFKDVIAEREAATPEAYGATNDDRFSADSALLDTEIDVTDELKGSLAFDHTSEDDRIRTLKEQDREDAAGGGGVDMTTAGPEGISYDEPEESSVFDEPFDDGADISDDQFDDAQGAREPSESTVGAEQFDDADLDSYTFDADENEDEDELTP